MSNAIQCLHISLDWKVSAALLSAIIDCIFYSTTLLPAVERLSISTIEPIGFVILCGNKAEIAYPLITDFQIVYPVNTQSIYRRCLHCSTVVCRMFARSIYEVPWCVAVSIREKLIDFHFYNTNRVYIQGFNAATINFLAHPQVWTQLQELRVPYLLDLDLTDVLQSEKRFVSVSCDYRYRFTSYSNKNIVNLLLLQFYSRTHLTSMQNDCTSRHKKHNVIRCRRTIINKLFASTFP